MKSELQKAADRVRKLQESKPPIVEAMKAANDMLGVRQQEMEQAALNLRAAQREAQYTEAAYEEHGRKLWIELEEVRTLTYIPINTTNERAQQADNCAVGLMRKH